ncbi:MAG: hypothetical protein JWL93_471 [Hyphomicrobiales bacterium]|nr:hypothetical protein [Hyphomicrobiales bacterium]
MNETPHRDPSPKGQTNPLEGVRLTPEQQKSRRSRNIAIAVCVGVLVVIFYALTIVKLGPGILERPL